MVTNCLFKKILKGECQHDKSQTALRGARTKKRQWKNENFHYRSIFGGEASSTFPEITRRERNKLTDPQTGRDMVSEISDGDTYTLSELGTSKIVKIVAISGLPLEVGEAYRIEGLGYDLRSSNMIFVDEDSVIEETQEV